jgi:hypothetical protein
VTRIGPPASSHGVASLVGQFSKLFLDEPLGHSATDTQSERWKKQRPAGAKWIS